MAWYKVGFCRLVWQLEQRGSGGAGEHLARDPGSATPSERRWEACLALGSVLSASGQVLNQEGVEARSGPDLLGAAIRILAS